MLLVTMPTTPGESPLSGVIAEAEGIVRCRQDKTVVTLELPTAEQVLEALPGYGIAHFACHGVSSSNPAESHLLLFKQPPWMMVSAQKWLTSSESKILQH